MLADGPDYSHNLDPLLSYVFYGDCFCSFVVSGSGVCLRVSPDVALSCAAINALNRESGLLTSCTYVPDSVMRPSVVLSVTIY